MMFVFSIILCGIVSVSCQTWSSRARLIDADVYFTELMQETIFELERYGWCNLKIPEYSQTLNEQMYQWHVAGTVNYTNGFLVSIQKLQLSNIEHMFSTRTIDGASRTIAVVRGMLNFRDAELGFDVLVNLEGEDAQRYTGEFTHGTIQYQCVIEKDLHTNEITTAARIQSLSAGSGVRMIYMPANNVTEVLSRRYVPSNNWDGASAWGTTVIAPMMLDVALHKIKFPEVCLNC